MLEANFNIRSATAEDQSVIRQLIYAGRLNPIGLSWRAFDLIERDDGELIGCGQIKRHRDGACELASLYIKPAFRSRGFAGTLIRHLQSKASSTLWLTCRSSLIPFYQKFSFILVTTPETMPRYFRRVWQIFRLFSRWWGIKDSLAVMRWNHS